MQMPLRYILMSLAYLLFGSALKAQDAAQFDLAASSFPDKDMIISEQLQHVHIDVKGDELEIFANNRFEMYYLRESANFFSRQSVYFDSFTEIDDLEANTYQPTDKPGKYKRIKVQDFEQKDVMSSGIFYGDAKEIQFDFPGIQPGAIAEYSYTEHFKEPYFLTKFFFSSYRPVLKSEFMVSHPENVKIKVRFFGDADRLENIVKIDSTHNGIRYEKWVYKNVPEYEFESGSPSIEHHEPHIILSIEEVTYDDVPTTYLNGLEGLYGWYHSLIKDVNKDTSPELKALVAEVTAGTTTPEEKARNIYYWVQEHIKYVAFEDGWGGFVPREAALVCDRRFGDCKDMSSIITAMLEIAGVSSNLVWIGSRDLPYKYSENPTPYVDNHMIAAANIGNEWVFLDGTGRYIPYGFPTAFIQGKEALISKGEGYEVVTVPTMPCEASVIADTTILDLKEDKIEGHTVRRYTGYKKYGFMVDDLSADASEKLEIMRQELKKGSNKYQLLEHKVSGKESRDEDLIVEANFELPDYAKFVVGDYYVNMHLGRDYKGLQIDENKRKLAREFNYKYTEREVVVLNIPEGFKLDYLPPNSEGTSELNGYSITYHEYPGKVVMEKEFYLNTLVLEPDNFETWNGVIKQMLEQSQEVLVLTKE